MAATALSGAMTGLLQASRHFKQLTAISLVNTALTGLLAIVLTLMGQLNLITALLILGMGTSLVGFGVGYYLLPKPFDLAWPQRSTWQAEGQQLWQFSRWLGVSNLLAVLTAQLDIILLNRWFTGPIGDYFLAINLIAKTDVLNYSMYTVLVPTASTLQNRAEMRAYVGQAWRRALVITGGLLLLFFLARPFIQLFYGVDFLSAVPLFQSLLLIVMFDLFTMPIILLAFPLNQPKLLATADALRIIILISGAVWLVPLYGTFGIIIAKGAAKVLGFLLTLVWLRQIGSQLSH
jgi:O-antigen/teichoic acid export membrane protein